MKKKTKAKSRTRKSEEKDLYKHHEECECDEKEVGWHKIATISFTTAIFVVLVMLGAYYLLGEQPSASLIAAVTAAVTASNSMVLYQLRK